MKDSVFVRAAQAAALFEGELAKHRDALSKGDLSLATFPRLGEDARVEMQTRVSQLQWVLEMLPAQAELDLLAQDRAAAGVTATEMRERAAALLAAAAALDGKELHLILHHHKFGETPYFHWGDTFPDEDDAAAIINAQSSYEPHLDEGITIVDVGSGEQELAQVCGIARAAAVTEPEEAPRPRG